MGSDNQPPPPEPSSNPREILTRPAPPADHRHFYGSAPDQFGDLRLPEGPGPFAVVVVIHGGCWRAVHSLEYMGHLAADLTRAGVATWNIEYRRLGQSGAGQSGAGQSDAGQSDAGQSDAGWPGTYLDVGRAIDHLRVLARDYPLDLRRVIVTGHSAGGHLTLWAAGRRRIPATSPLYLPDPLPLTAAIPLAGLTDLNLPGTACDDELERMRGPELRETSPVMMLPIGLPVTVVQGDADEAVPLIQATTYVEAAERSGDQPELALFSGADHFVIVDPRSSRWPEVRTAILRLVPPA